MKTLYFFLLGVSVALAQPKPTGINALTPKDEAAIQAQARQKLTNLLDLLNTISYEDLAKADRDEVIKNSLTPNPNQVFTDESALIENDLDPALKGGAAMPVRTYLLLFDSLYVKAKSSVSFSNIRPVISRNAEGPYVKIFYTATFGSTNSQTNASFAPTNRVAECAVRREGKGWSVLITRLSFENPGEGQTLRTDLTEKDKLEIQAIARDKITKGLSDLLNTLTVEGNSTYDDDALIKGSVLPGSSQLFLNDGVIVEDDIDPAHTTPQGAVDTPVETYLRNLSLFYRKTPKPGIRLSNVRVVKFMGNAKPVVQVAFTSSFGSKHSQIDKPYVPTSRLAEFQAECVGKRWSVLITRLAFENVVVEPPRPTTASDLRYKKLKRQGWLMVLGGVAGLAGGYLTYTKLQSDYSAYTARVATLNSEFDQWRELSAQPTGSRMTPLSFTQYAGNSSYIAYGTSGTGLGLTVAGVAKLVKAGRLKRSSTTR